jgi:hypothetical protein
LAWHHHIIFDGPTCEIRDKTSNEVVAEGEEHSNLYCLVLEPITAIAHHDESTHLTTDINVLHRCLGHVDHDSIKCKVAKGHLKGITSVSGKETFCKSRIKAKMKKLPFKHERTTAIAPLALIHSDIGGPITPQSSKGFCYWITFIDDYTCYP